MSQVTSLKYVQDSLLSASDRRKDCILKDRISKMDHVDKAARYHHKCYQIHISDRKIF